MYNSVKIRVSIIIIMALAIMASFIFIIGEYAGSEKSYNDSEIGILEVKNFDELQEYLLRVGEMRLFEQEDELIGRLLFRIFELSLREVGRPIDDYLADYEYLAEALRQGFLPEDIHANFIYSNFENLNNNVRLSIEDFFHMNDAIFVFLLTELLFEYIDDQIHLSLIPFQSFEDGNLSSLFSSYIILPKTRLVLIYDLFN